MDKRLWLDDRRRPPWGYDLWAKTVEECIHFLQTYQHEIKHVSLDHDLDESHYDVDMDVNVPIDRSQFTVLTGYAVVEWMVERNIWVPDISVHTLNPRGAFDMLSKIQECAPPYVQFRRVPPHEI